MSICKAQPSGTIAALEEFCALQSIEFVFSPTNGATAINWLVDDLPAQIEVQTDTSIILNFDQSALFTVCGVATDGTLLGDTICREIGVILPLAVSELQVVCDSVQDSFRLIIPVTGGHSPYTISPGDGVIINDTIFTTYFPNGGMSTIFIEDFIGCTNQVFIDSISCDCAPLFLPDTAICQYPFDLFIPDSLQGGNWSILHTALSFSYLNDSIVRFSSAQPGEYLARYFGEINGCFIDDTLSLRSGDYPTVPHVTVDTFCNVSRSHYWVSFNVAGGDPSSYQVNGMPIMGNSFLSDSIPSGSAFLFVLSDGNGCGRDTIQGSYVCECLSSIGNLDTTHRYICDDTLFAANYYDPSGQVISGNDVRNYLLVRDTMDIANSILQRTVDGVFRFDAAQMMYGETYFVILVIGNATPGDTVLLTDICLLQSGVMPVTWLTPLEVGIETPSTELNCNFPQIIFTLNSEFDLSVFSMIWRADNGGVIRGDSTSRTLVVADPGEYYVRVYHPLADCDTTISISITEDPFIPMVNIQLPDTLTCNNTEVLLLGENSSSGTSIIYSWDGPGILSDPNMANITVSLPGNYTLTVTDTSSDCMVLDSVQVFADIDPPVVQATAANGIGCTFLTTIISGEGSDIGLEYGYMWSSLDSGTILSNPSFRDIEVDAVGRYRFIVRNTFNGCSDSIDVMVHPIDAMIDSFALDAQQVQCDTPFSGSIQITSVSGGTPPFEYSIDGGQTWNTIMLFDNLTYGRYPVVVRDSEGCEASTNVVLAEPIDFEIDLGEDIAVPLGDSVHVTLMSELSDSLRFMYAWNPLYDTLRSSQPDQIFQLPIGYHSIMATLTSVNGCSASDELNVYVYLVERVYVPNAIHPLGQQNENREFFIFSDPVMVSRITNLHIFDRWGEQVYNRPVWPVTLSYLSGVGWDGMIDNEPAHSGVYVYYFDVEFVDGSVHREKGEFILIR